MIELDVYTYVSADATLLGLIGGTVSDTRIYPKRAPQGVVAPYITYDADRLGDMEEFLHQDRIQFKVVADNKVDANAITKALIDLLDLQDSISITSTDYSIKWMKLVDGQDMEDPDTENFIVVQIYEGRYLKL